MAIVSKATKRIEVPHEPGQWMEIRKLSWRQLEAASDVATEAAMKRMKEAGPEMMAALRKLVEGQVSGQQASNYDRHAVLKSGIAGWSYDEPVSDENIDLLDEETAKWAVDAILDLKKPLSEEERKNA